MYMFAGYASVCHSRGVCLVEVFAHATCVFVCRGDCETHICVCVSTDGAKMTKSTGVCSTVLWGLYTTDLCQSARHRATVRLARTAMEQSGLTRWNVAELAVLYALHAGVPGRYGLHCTVSWCDMMVCLFVHQCPTNCRESRAWSAGSVASVCVFFCVHVLACVCMCLCACACPCVCVCVCM